MSASSSIRMGAAFVELHCKDNLLVTGLKAAEQKIKAFGKAISGIGVSFAALGGSIFAPLMAAAHSFAESGSELLLLSQRTGISVEALSRLKYAAGQSGVATEDLEGALRHMGKTVQAAADGSQTARESLASLGVTVQDLANLSKEDILLRLASGVSNIANPLTRGARALEVFGKKGETMLPMLQRGQEGIRGLMNQADRLGLTKSEESVQAAFRLQVAFKTLGKVGESAFNSLGSAIAGPLTDALNNLVPHIVSMGRWVKANRELVIAVGAASGAVVGLGMGFIFAGKAVSALALLISPIGAAVKLVSGVAAGALHLMFTPLLSLLSPSGLILGLIAGGGIALVAMVAKGSGALDSLADGFRTIGGIASSTWGGMKDAIAAGDWVGAAEIGWLGIQAAWEAGIGSLSTAWLRFSGFFEDQWRTAVNNVAQYLAKFIDDTKKAIADLATSLGGISGASTATPIVAGMVASGAVRPAGPGETPGTGPGAAPMSSAQTVAQTLAQQHADEVAKAQAELADAERGNRLWRMRPGGPQEQLDVRNRQAASDKSDALHAQGHEEGLALMERMRGGAGEALDQSRAKVDTAGTFSAYAVGGMGAASTTERLLERIAENTGRPPMQIGLEQ